MEFQGINNLIISGIMEPEFVSKVPSFFNCSICLSYIKNCVSTPCHHKFCKNCIENSLNLSSNCPICIVHISQTSLNPDKWVDSQINNLQVYCLMKKSGCPWKGNLNDLNVHIESTCEHVPLTCQNVCCKTVLPRKKMTDHLKSCNYRKITCEFCSSNILYCSKDSHLSTECPKVSIKCQFCRELIPKNKMDEHHISQCKYIPIVCPYGCEKKVIRIYLDDHIRNKATHHLKILGDMIKLLQTEVNELKQNRKVEKEFTPKKINNIIELKDNEVHSSEITYILVWNVDQNKLKDSMGKRISSPMFKIKDSEFNIQLFAIQNENSSILSYFLHSEKLASPLKLSYKLWNEGCKDETIFQICNLTFEKNDEEYGWSGVNYESTKDIQIKLEIVSIE